MAFKRQLTEKSVNKEMARKYKVHRGLLRKTKVLKKKERKWFY